MFFDLSLALTKSSLTVSWLNHNNLQQGLDFLSRTALYVGDLYGYAPSKEGSIYCNIMPYIIYTSSRWKKAQQHLLFLRRLQDSQPVSGKTPVKWHETLDSWTNLLHNAIMDHTGPGVFLACCWILVKKNLPQRVINIRKVYLFKWPMRVCLA